MSNSSKVYVIDPKTGRSTGVVKSSERVEYSPEIPTGAPSGSDAATKQKSSRKALRTDISRILMPLTSTVTSWS